MQNRFGALTLVILIPTLPAIALPELGEGIVACSFSETAEPFDLETFAFGTTISVMPEGQYPYDATMSPEGLEVWIPGASGDGIVVIDRGTGSVSHRIDVGDYPVSLAFSPDGSLALVSCRSDDAIQRIDTASYLVTGSTPVVSSYLGPGHIAIDPVSGFFYAVEWYSETLYEISPDGESVTREAPFGDSLWQLVASPDGTRLYVADRGLDVIWVVDRASLEPVDIIFVGDDPWGLDITEDGGTLVVACEDSQDIWILDLASGDSISLALPPDSEPRDVDILDAEGLAFVTGGWLGDGGSPVYIVDISGQFIQDTIFAPGTMTNAIAVQPQMHGDGTPVDENPAAALRLGAWPNPFNPRTEIRFVVDDVGPVDLAIYDAGGARVRVLYSGAVLEAGEHHLLWNGRDEAGRRLAGGVYLLNLETGRGTEQLKVVLLK